MDQQKFNPRESEHESITPDFIGSGGVKDLENKVAAGGQVKNADGGFLNKESLAKKESLTSKSKSAATTALLNTTPQGRILNRIKKNRLGIGGATVFAAVLIAVFGTGMFADYAIVTIAKDLVGFETKVEQEGEDDAAKHIMKQLLQDKICNSPLKFSPSNARTCKKYLANQEDDKTSSGEEEPLEQDMDDFSFTDPAIEQDLSKSGISVETDSSGNFEGLQDSSGQEVTPDDIGDDNGGVFDEINESMPEWEVGQETSFVPQTEAVDGADYDIGTSSSEDDIDKAIQDEITTGDDATSSGESSSNQAEDALDSELKAAEQAAASKEDSGGTEDEDLSAAKDTLNADDASDLVNTIGALQLACNADKAITIADKDRIPEVMGLLVRHSSTLLSLSDESKTNKITGKEASDVEKLFAGNPDLPATIKSGNSVVRNEAAEPFTNSAQWQEISGNPVNTNPKSLSYTAGLASTASPTENATQSIINSVNSIIGDTPLGTVCSILNGPLGIVAGVGGITLEILNSEDPLADGAEAAGNTAIVGGVQEVLLPDAIKLILPIGLDGREDAVQWMNNSGAGENIASNDYARSLGAEPDSTSEANAQYATAISSSDQSESHTSLTNRVFALSNPKSLFSKIALDIPFEKQTLFSDISNFFVSVPKEITQLFGDIFSFKFAHADILVSNPGASDGLTQYGFNYIDKYDIPTNEQYLYSDVSYGGASATRISLLGDPNQYNDSNIGSSPDTNTNDLLHCFLQPYNGSNKPADNNSPQAPCETEGNFDLADDNNGSPKQISASDVAWVYCTGLGQSNSTGSGCMDAMTAEAQANDDVDRFSQYIMDMHVMSDYSAMQSGSSSSQSQ